MRDPYKGIHDALSKIVAPAHRSADQIRLDLAEEKRQRRRQRNLRQKVCQAYPKIQIVWGVPIECPSREWLVARVVAEQQRPIRAAGAVAH